VCLGDHRRRPGPRSGYRQGRIDVLVNNAASFFPGYFEELTAEQLQLQLSTSLVGPMNVTRTFLPAMRKQRSGIATRYDKLPENYLTAPKLVAIRIWLRGMSLRPSVQTILRARR
jgi:NAD(P)-dependent dehydrogenase (short-subunit alcohol dehydrogenase family)